MYIFKFLVQEVIDSDDGEDYQMSPFGEDFEDGDYWLLDDPAPVILENGELIKTWNYDKMEWE